ncbi:histidine--tRNA ligase [Candidatus Saccharibacteria bacterium]|nr:histidine--tRNA ligase [Candidatus Saccharibacteria bacterium]
MKKLNTTPISGMQELLPEKQIIFDDIKNKIEETYKSHGFQKIETPTIDRSEILFAKAGGDTEKQIYKVVKTAETAEDADQALRFDHTVPLARYVVEHESSLNFPFRVTQIGKNFRGERAQKGRFREFYQLDIDVVGRETLPIAYDAEVIATLYDALKSFLKPKMLIRVSNRKILSGLIEAQNLQEKSAQLFSIIDHAEKVSPEKTAEALDEIGLNQDQKDLMNSFMSIKGPRAEVIEKLAALNIENETTKQGIKELDEVLKLLDAQDAEAIGDMLIVRGLDYYTGTVFETFLPDYQKLGSICSGGRYENLARNYTDQNFPGVGGSIGLTRLFSVLDENNLLSNETEDGKPAVALEKPIDIAIVPISENENEYSLKLAKLLRTKGFSTDTILTDKKLGAKLTHAAKIAKFGIVIGENEAKTSELKIKNFETGEEKPLSSLNS